MAKLLVVKCFYNVFVEQRINQYLDNILFVNIDLDNMNILIKQYNITKYMNFFEYAKNVSQYNIVSYYNEDILSNKYIYIGNKNSKNIRYINNVHKLIWKEYFNNKKAYYFIDKNTPLYNIPQKEILLNKWQKIY